MAAASPGSPCRTDVQLVPAAVPASEACPLAGRGLGTGRILDSMALDIAAVQAALAEDGLDGWLLYDFHGTNPIARALAGLNGGGHMTTRRWYYLIPRIGSPRALVHAIEPNKLDTLPGDKIALRRTRSAGAGPRPPASTACAAWRWNTRPRTRSRICRASMPAPSSLSARAASRWSRPAISSSGSTRCGTPPPWNRTGGLGRALPDQGSRLRGHPRASGRRHADHRIRHPAADGAAGSRRKASSTDALPRRREQENAGNPHYLPTATGSRRIGSNELVLLDLWGKLATAGAVYADITWVGFTGAQVPDEFARAFDAIAARSRRGGRPREAAARATGADLRGWEVDRAAREVLLAAGYGAHVLHRTGHSLGEDVHGNGVHMDDYETHDDRRLLAGTGFTIEPGLYFDAFRRADRNQHVRRARRGAGDRPVPGRHRPARVVNAGEAGAEAPAYCSRASL